MENESIFVRLEYSLRLSYDLQTMHIRFHALHSVVVYQKWTQRKRKLI